ncbi:hypothetical protein IU433_12355 [Nocardia puris]|uniref:hypothetical protein n=1 Tax=Nocardia puris TaxID=208602 RepID=UPI001894C2DB|nr:hypothetical protein [Nocardia puris]MBF6459829.1 hypothetical protein [Nocardia puris]
MARDHGRVLCRIWRDRDFRALPRTAQALYVQLVSQQEINNAGVLPLMLSKWAKGCDELTSDGLVKDLAALIDGRFVVVDSDSEEVLVRSFIRNDGVLKQPNVFKNALRCAEQVESGEIRRVLAAELRRTGRRDAVAVADEIDPSGGDSEPFENPSTRVPEPFENPSESPSDESAENPRSNPSETLPEPIAKGLRVPEPFPEPCGVGEGVGEGENSSYVVGHLGGVARADTRAARARTREATPTPDEPPNPNCPRHPGGTTDPCGHCADARKRRAAYDAAAAERAALERSEETRRAAEVRRRAITACQLCDDDGYQGTAVCTHQPPPRARPTLREQVEAMRAETAQPATEPEESHA